MSFVCSVLLMFISYELNSLVYSFGGDLTTGQWTERVRAFCKSDADYVPDSIALVNVTYDKKLMRYEAVLDQTDQECYFREYVGDYTVTDRGKLLSLLNALDSVDYRYIMLDIRFAQGFESDSVSLALFRKIKEMDNIVIAKHSNHELSDPELNEKAASSDYYTTFLESSLVKYPVVESEGATIPGRMYRDLCGRDISNHRLWFLDNGELCYGSMFLTYPIRVTKWKRPTNEERSEYAPQYLNLGQDIIAKAEQFDFRAYFENKIVVVGDFVEDIHETYVGTLPGALVNLNAYVALTKGVHLVNWWWLLFIGVVYFAICLGLFKKRSVFDYISFIRSSKSIVLRFVVSLVGYSTLLMAISYVSYIFFGTFYSVKFPALYFAILSTIVRYHYMKYKR
ncbi:MAG: CHASE2 domain-containing protein [Alistipes sp.]|nr:CHASE2 domain-containing protein [Alistipes sp.]